MSRTPDGLPPLPDQQKDTPAMKEEPSRPSPERAGADHRPPAHAGDTWVVAQLREKLHRVSAALVSRGEAVDPPPLERSRDLEPEP